MAVKFKEVFILEIIFIQKRNAFFSPHALCEQFINTLKSIFLRTKSDYEFTHGSAMRKVEEKQDGRWK